MTKEAARAPRGLELRAKPVIPPVNTASPGGQRECFMRKEAGFRAQSRTLYFTSEHSTTWCSDGILVRKEAGFRAQRRL